jgi:cyanophycinase
VNPLQVRFLPRALALLVLTLATTPAGAQQPRGHLFIVGGGAQSDSLVARFVSLAGGRGHARIAVVPMASGGAQASGDEKAAQLRDFGADAFVLLITRAQAESAATARRLADVTGIWFTGGDQTRLAPLLRGTVTLAAMQARYRAGAVVGGTSAGAAVLSDSMLTGNQHPPGDTLGYYGDEFPAIARGVIEVVPGLGFLSGVIVDQHFIRRERHNRLFAAVLERPTLLGAGIDESTALEIGPDGKWTVRGAGAVVVYDARHARITAAGPTLGASGVVLHLLPAGTTFDPTTARISLPR